MFIYIYIYTICYLYYIYIYILSSIDALTKEIFDLENHRFAETSWGETSFISNLVDGPIYPQYIWENIFFGKVICFGEFISFLFRHIVHCIRNEQFHNFLGRPQVGIHVIACNSQMCFHFETSFFQTESWGRLDLWQRVRGAG